MTSTAWQSAALERIILPWVAKIAEVFGVIVAIIVANAKEVRTIHATARAFVVDISGKSEALIKAQLAEPWAREPSRRLMTSIAMTPPARISHISMWSAPVEQAEGAKGSTMQNWTAFPIADAGRKVMGSKGAKVYDR